jgi:hypothetical protein
LLESLLQYRLNTVGLELSAGDKTAEMVEIIRDVNSNAELQSSVTVKVKVDNSPEKPIIFMQKQITNIKFYLTSFTNYLQLR